MSVCNPDLSTSLAPNLRFSTSICTEMSNAVVRIQNQTGVEKFDVIRVLVERTLRRLSTHTYIYYIYSVQYFHLFNTCIKLFSLCVCIR